MSNENFKENSLKEEKLVDAIVADQAEEVKEVVKVENKKRPFFINDEEINAFSPVFRDALLLKKANRKIPNRNGYLAYQLVFMKKVKAQKIWAMLIDYGMNIYKCDICGENEEFLASVEWMGRVPVFKDGVKTREYLEKRVVIPHVCEKCLKEVGVAYMDFDEYVVSMWDNANDLKVAEKHNAKDLRCMMCPNLTMSSDSTWMWRMNGGFLQKIALCDHHLEKMMNHGLIEKVDAKVVEDLGSFVAFQVSAFARKKNKKKITEEKLPNKLDTGSVDAQEYIKEKFTDEDFRLESKED